MGLSTARSICTRLFVIVTLVSLFLVLALQTTLAQTPPPSATTSPVIATATALAVEQEMDDSVMFFSDREGQWHTYLINTNGTNERPLTGKMPVVPSHEAIRSPDGKYIAFQSHLDRSTQIYLINIDGTAIHWLMEDPHYDIYTTWLPDSKQLGFTSYRDEGQNIYTLDIESRQLIRLTPNDGSENSKPLWSPDGTKIAFISDRDGEDNLYFMNADGSDVRLVTADKDSYNSYSWSPDSKTLIFSSNRDGNLNLYTFQLDTEVIDQLTFRAANYDPVWSPDGTKIVFTSTRYRNGDPNLYTMDGNGKSLTQITYSDFENFNYICPSWTPDSQKIVVLGGVWSHDNVYPAPDLRTGNAQYDVFIMNATGGGKHALTADSYGDMVSNCAIHLFG